MKKKILVLATGGTIASGAGSNGLEPSLQANGLLPYLVGVAENYEITAKDILHLDSSNIQPEKFYCKPKLTLVLAKSTKPEYNLPVIKEKLQLEVAKKRK